MISAPSEAERARALPDPPPLSVDDAIFIHAFLAAQFGGTPGVGDQGKLEIALARPLALFHGEPYYPSPFQRAAALGHALMVHTPFSIHNTRTAVALMAAWLEREGHRLGAPRGQLRLVGEAMAQLRLTVLDIADWLEHNSMPLAAG